MEESRWNRIAWVSSPPLLEWSMNEDMELSFDSIVSAISALNCPILVTDKVHLCLLSSIWTGESQAQCIVQEMIATKWSLGWN